MKSLYASSLLWGLPQFPVENARYVGFYILKQTNLYTGPIHKQCSNQQIWLHSPPVPLGLYNSTIKERLAPLETYFIHCVKQGRPGTLFRTGAIMLSNPYLTDPWDAEQPLLGSPQSLIRSPTECIHREQLVNLIWNPYFFTNPIAPTYPLNWKLNCLNTHLWT